MGANGLNQRIGVVIPGLGVDAIHLVPTIIKHCGIVGVAPGDTLPHGNGWLDVLSRRQIFGTGESLLKVALGLVLGGALFHAAATGGILELRPLRQDHVIAVLLRPCDHLPDPILIRHLRQRHIHVLVPPSCVQRNAPYVGMKGLAIPGDPLLADPRLLTPAHRVAKLQLRPVEPSQIDDTALIIDKIAMSDM